MEAIYASLIIMIFSAWIWDLKHQVKDLRDVVLPEEEEPEVRTAHIVSHSAVPQRLMHTAKFAEQPAHAGPARAGRPVRRDNGVATWVID
jgi:hypothetical protein